MMWNRAAGPLCLLFALVARCLAGAQTPKVLFQEQIEPVLVARCLECHGSEKEGGLDLRSRASALVGGDSGAVIVPGQPEESWLLDRVADGEMPPDERLSNQQIAAFRRWIEQDVYYPDSPLDPYARTTERRAGHDWWSLQPLAKERPPDATAFPPRWRSHPIDRFVYSRLMEQGLSPSRRADRRSLIRRVTYDLTGLPPTPEEITRFLRDPSDDAYTKLVDRLLQSPRYGEHWGRHWLDVIRFGESTGFERNIIINDLWPLRDYVIRSFNRDKPFRDLVLEHLAGDVLHPGNADVEVATAFLVCGPYDNVGNQDAIQAARIRADTIDEMIRATGETFLGLTVGCGRCHNHKFDPITQRDYYGLYATFAGVFHGRREIATAQQRQRRDRRLAPLTQRRQELREAIQALEAKILARTEHRIDAYESRWTRPPANRHGTEETFAPVAARYLRLIVDSAEHDPSQNSGYRIDEVDIWTAGPNPRNVARLEQGATADGKSRIAEDFQGAYGARRTIDGQFGACWVAHGPELTIKLGRPETIERVVFSSDRLKAAGAPATFVADYRIAVSMDGQHWIRVADSRDRSPIHAAHRRKRLIEAAITDGEQQRLAELRGELHRLAERIAAVEPLPTMWAGNFRQPDQAVHVFHGGDPQRQGPQVVPASLSAIDHTAVGYRLPAGAPEGQRRLALARWLVAADHPLTARVLANRLWHYHFGTGIVATPSDFGFMGDRPSHPQLLDWLARLVHDYGWRLKPIHRLIVTSEAYRQSADYRQEPGRRDAECRWLWRFPPRRLSAEEIRDSMLYASGLLRPVGGGAGFRLYRYLEDNVATYVPLDNHGPDTYRRAVYHQNARAARVDLMAEFDAPDCAFAAPRRAATTTPLQALTLMNHDLTSDVARALAARLRREAGADHPDQQIRRAFVLLVGRRPASEERHAARAFLRKFDLPALARVLLNSNEFIYLH